MIRVLIADDQDLVRAGFRMILEGESDIHVVAEARDGREAISLTEEHRPDVVLMDIRMPVLDGIEAARVITVESAAKVLILTTFDLDEYVYSALRAGASGFLLKDAKADDLAEAVRVVYAGDALLAPSVTRRLVAHFVAQQPTAPREASLRELTDREREILVLIAKGLSNQEIGKTLYISEGTVKTHVGRIFAKLDVRHRAQAVIVAYDAGLVTPAPADSLSGRCGRF